MKLLCSGCLHVLDAEGYCRNRACSWCTDPTGYTVPPARVTDQPDPFPAEVCPTCGQPVPQKA